MFVWLYSFTLISPMITQCVAALAKIGFKVKKRTEIAVHASTEERSGSKRSEEILR